MIDAVRLARAGVYFSLLLALGSCSSPERDYRSGSGGQGGNAGSGDAGAGADEGGAPAGDGGAPTSDGGAAGSDGDCTPDERDCDGPEAEKTCSDEGTWISMPCANGCLEGACVEECSDEGETRCRDGNTPERCDGATWVAEDDCGGDTAACDEGTGLCKCVEGTHRCLDGNTPEACNSAGVWVPQDDCTGDAPVCEAGVCQCDEGEKHCDDTQTSRTCTAGAWEEESCSGDLAVCDDASGACVRPLAVAHQVHCDFASSLVCSGTDVCCVRPADEIEECTTEADCIQGSGNAHEYVCDDESDCPAGKLCCLFGDPLGLRTVCGDEADGCDNGGTYLGEATCDPDADDCPLDETCQAYVADHPVIYVCMPP